MAQEPEKQKDFFISYTSTDSIWAQWIAFELEAAGYTTVIQAWDSRPGMNFVGMRCHNGLSLVRFRRQSLAVRTLKGDAFCLCFLYSRQTIVPFLVPIANVSLYLYHIRDIAQGDGKHRFVKELNGSFSKKELALVPPSLAFYTKNMYVYPQ